mgnify:CR=1 FL=1
MFNQFFFKEEIIIPSVDTIYPEADWIIGNHSDELTSWIPIMAKFSNDHCQYFVLPCCPYELNGQKFQRKNSSMSSYQDFIYYVKNISEMCDFNTLVDRLRIPSSKKVCLVGFRKGNFEKNHVTQSNSKIINYIKFNCQSHVDVQKNYVKNLKGI